MSKRYEIDKITDIFKIPEDKFEDFLVDFKSYYQFGLHLTTLIDEVAKAGGMVTNTVPQKMVWIDDGKHDAKIILNPTNKSMEEQP